MRRHSEYAVSVRVPVAAAMGTVMASVAGTALDTRTCTAAGTIMDRTNGGVGEGSLMPADRTPIGEQAQCHLLFRCFFVRSQCVEGCFTMTRSCEPVFSAVAVGEESVFNVLFV